MIVGLLFLSIGAETANPRPAPKTAASITISVFTDAGLPETVLVQAEARAAQIMGQAGVHVAWLNCYRQNRGSGEGREPLPVDCLAIRFPQHLSVRILRRPLTATQDTFGQSFLDAAGQGCYADIYHANFELLGSESTLSDAEILGHVMAHEAGHLLLGQSSHSSLGLMRAHWDRGALKEAAEGTLRFTPAQAVAMRERLTAFGVAAAKIPPSAQI